MRDILEKRKKTTSLAYSSEEELKSSSDWVGTLKFFSLYPYFLLFFVFPIIFIIKEYTFQSMFTVLLSYTLGCCLGKFFPLLFFTNEKELIRKYLLTTEILIALSFLFLSFAIYEYEGVLFISIIWFIIGSMEEYHIYLEKIFLKKVISFSPYKVRYLTDSKEAMLQSLFFFMLAIFIFIIMPSILGALISLFDYSDKNFSIAISLGFGTFILFFIFVYHLTLGALLPINKNPSSSFRIKKINITRINSFLKYSYQKYINKIKKDPSSSIFSIASFLPLLSLNYMFLAAFNISDNTYYPLTNLVIASSIYLIFRTIMFFYFQNIFNIVNPNTIASISVFIFTIILSLYAYAYEFSNLNFGILTIFFVSLRLSRDIIALAFFHRIKKDKITVNAKNLSKGYNKMPLLELLISVMLSLFYPLVGILGIYFICLLLLFSYFIIPKNKKV